MNFTPLKTSFFMCSGFITRPSASRNSSHLSRGGPLVTLGLGPSSTPLIKKNITTGIMEFILNKPVRLLVSYTCDQFKSRLFFRLWRQTWIPRCTGLTGGVRRTKSCLEEVGDFGETTKCGGIRIENESLSKRKKRMYWCSVISIFNEYFFLIKDNCWIWFTAES